MKNILILLAFILMIGSISAQTIMYYWNFNNNVPAENTSWAQPIASNVGAGNITYSLTEVFSFAGTTINGVDGEVNGGSLAPRGGLDNVNNGAYIQISAPTVGFDNILFSYPTRRTSTGFTTHEISYTLNGNDWVQIETVSLVGYANNWVASQMVNIDFTGITGVGDNANFAIRIYFDGCTSATGNNRIDNIKIIGSASGGVAAPTFNPPAGSYDSPINVNIVCATPGASIYYTLDGSNPTDGSALYSTPIPISTSTTIKAKAYATGLSPSPISTANYAFSAVVANLTELWAQPVGTPAVFTVSGEVIVTFQQSFRNQKYVQDAGRAILIDDPSGIMGASYSLYDGITGITGTLAYYTGMLQFTPTTYPGPPTSSGNQVTPIVTTISNLNDNFPTMQSKLVKINDVSISNPTGNFANGADYTLIDTTGQIILRTQFYDVDFIGTPVPTGSFNLTAICIQYNTTHQVVPRFLVDFEETGPSVAAPVFNPPAGNYYQPVNVSMTTSTTGATIYYTTDGSNPTTSSSVYSTPVTISATTTLKAIAHLTGQPSSPVTTALYSFPVSVSNITNLRNQTPGTNIYILSGEAILTFKQNFRNQKYVQDNGAAILVDDPAGIITINYNIGDGITGLSGTLSNVENMLRFTPTYNPGAPTSTGNNVQPLVVPIQSFLNNFVSYEARLIKIEDVFFDTTAPLFDTATIYPLNDAFSPVQINFRTSFPAVDYLNTAIPQLPGHIIGIANANTSGSFITSRSLNDITTVQLEAPSYLNASLVDNVVTLQWGFADAPWGLTGFRIYRNDVQIGSILANPPYQFVHTIQSAGLYAFTVRAVYYNEYLSDLSPIAEVSTSSTPENDVSIVTALKSNYPNPFNPSTTIYYSIQEAGDVQIGIYNSKGQLVKTLVNASKASGSYSVVWTGKDELGNPVSSGVYYYKMISGKYSNTRKMLLLK